MTQATPRLIVICGPIASGKSTLARAAAEEFERSGATAAAVDLDVVYEMLEHAGAAKDDVRKWARARRAAAALADALLADGVAVVIVEGDFLTANERKDFVEALHSSVEPRFVTLGVSLDLAFRRVDMDPTRGASRDHDFLRSHYESASAAVRDHPRTDLALDTGKMELAEAVRAVTGWSAATGGASAASGS